MSRLRYIGTPTIVPGSKCGNTNSGDHHNCDGGRHLNKCRQSGESLTRRTNEDKQKAVTALLTDEEWLAKGSRWIAEKCLVTHRYVNKLKESLGIVPSEERYTNKHGNETTMNTSKIGN